MFRPSLAVFPPLLSLAVSSHFSPSHTFTFTATSIWFVSSALVSHLPGRFSLCRLLSLSFPTLYTDHVVQAEDIYYNHCLVLWGAVALLPL